MREGVAIGREAQAISRELPERMGAMSSWALGLRLAESGEYEEALELAGRGTELARKIKNAVLLAVNLDRLVQAHEALLNLQEARVAYEETLERQDWAFSYARLCVVAALSENWEDAHAHAKRAHEAGTFFNPLFSIDLHHEVEALVRGGDERLAREEVRRFAERAEAYERDRIAYLRSLAILSEWEGDTKRATGHLHEGEALAEKLGLPGELWQIQARTGELHERGGEAGEAREAFSRAGQLLRNLAEKIGDQELREGFLSTYQVSYVLARL